MHSFFEVSHTSIKWSQAKKKKTFSFHLSFAKNNISLILALDQYQGKSLTKKGHRGKKIKCTDGNFCPIYKVNNG